MLETPGFASPPWGFKCNRGSRAGVRLEMSIMRARVGLVVCRVVRLLEATN